MPRSTVVLPGGSSAGKHYLVDFSPLLSSSAWFSVLPTQHYTEVGKLQYGPAGPIEQKGTVSDFNPNYMDGRGRAFDNIFVERLWRSVKHEDIYLKGYTSMGELMAGLSEYFDFYNEERPHQSLGNLTPDAVYRTAAGGGAMIVDKYPRTVEESSVPPGLIEVVQATAGLCRLAMIEVQRVA